MYVHMYILTYVVTRTFSPAASRHRPSGTTDCALRVVPGIDEIRESMSNYVYKGQRSQCSSTYSSSGMGWDGSYISDGMVFVWG